MLIQVSDETWDYLNKQKKPGETFDEVLHRIIKEIKIREVIQSGNRDSLLRN